MHVVLQKKSKTFVRTFEGVKTNVMRMKIALTCGIDRQIKDASCILLVIHWLQEIGKKENYLKRNEIEIQST